ncbi:MAG: 5'/3'-nucleotidase SurE [Phycisphaerae bacterium]|nr:5'/3'-nucleotidase SurE [Phycisphaerae bacterium]
MMYILLSNDDGITAPGLAALARAVEGLGELAVAAPDSPQSAMAHSITLHQPLMVKRVRLEHAGGIEGLAIGGRPADCVRLAVRNLLPRRPDVVLSGLNAGANVGVNVFYSGTVAAAAEGAMFGIPSVAFSLSLENGQADPLAALSAAAEHCRTVLDTLLAHGLSPGELVNVNIPLTGDGAPRGVRVCEQSDAEVLDRYVLEESSPAGDRYRLCDDYDFHAPHHASDVALLREGYITVTPLRISLTDPKKLGDFPAEWLA